MAHNHSSHEHEHNHNHISQINKAFIVGIVLNAVFVLVEVIAGFVFKSMSLLTDAGHNLSDVISLLLAFMAVKLATVKPNEHYTYGYRKSTVLVALLNSLILLIAIGAIGFEAFNRLNNPVEVEGKSVAITAFIGIFINGFTAFLFMKGKEKDLNVKSAYLHLAADALVSVGVVVAGILILVTKLYWIDSVVSIIIMLIILYSTWKLLTESLRLSLDGVPKGINISDVKKAVLNTKGVTKIHDLHIWAISTTQTALTLHLVVDEKLNISEHFTIKSEVSGLLKKLNIHHITLEIETNTQNCEFENCLNDKII